MTKGKVTVILNVYRRPELLKKQYEALKRQTIKPDHIWIWQNKSPENHKVKNPGGCILVRSNYNFMYHSRFALALLAQPHSEYVMLFDDDNIPGPGWLENCLDCMEKEEALYVGVGTRITEQGVKRDWWGWRTGNEDVSEVDYGGHCWFLKAEWLRHFWSEEQICWTNAEDIQISYALQKNLGLKTLVPPHPEKDKNKWSNIAGWVYGRSDKASHKNPPSGQKPKEWFADRRNVERELIRRGWKTINEIEVTEND